MRENLVVSHSCNMCTLDGSPLMVPYPCKLFVNYRNGDSNILRPEKAVVLTEKPKF
jgi:hypothetical protein